MIGYVYIIKNKINNKVYIGKTYKTIDKRFTRHKNVAKFEKHRKLYKAMLKYGFENFYIETLGEYEENILEEKEIYFINRYNSFKDGYNSTLGGGGHRYCNLDSCKVLKTFELNNSIIETANFYNVDKGTIREILYSYNIFPDKIRRNENKVLICESLNIIFNSTKEAAKYLIDNQISTVSLKSTEQSIRRACLNYPNRKYKNLLFKREIKKNV